MTKDLDEIIYAALTIKPSEDGGELTTAEKIQALTEGRIYSTCVEVPPTEDDNTPVPYIVITDDQTSNEQGTKDNIWEGITDHVAASVYINATSPYDVRILRRLVRKAVTEYVMAMENQDPPFLTALTQEGIAWDWTKPCYYDTLHYSCDMDVNYETNE